MATVLSSLASPGLIAGASAQKAFSWQLLLLHEGEHVWSGFTAQETTIKQGVPKEQELAQVILCPMENRGLREKKAPVAS